MFLFYRLTGRRGKRWETEREGGNDPAAKSCRKFNNKEKEKKKKNFKRP